MPGIYIHIPFCVSRCGYCDFFSSCDLSPKEEMLGALLREMRLRRDFLDETSLDTLYVGGGTPSVYSPEQLARITQQAAQLWDTTGLKESTAEVNPDDVDEKYFAGLLEAGFGRVSMGIQSFSDRDLRLMGRRHDAQAAQRAVEDARRAGIRNISIDLIFGIPGMDTARWEEGIRRALSLAPEHISAYHLTIEERTRFGAMAARGELVPVAEQHSEEQYLTLHSMLTAAGYEHYEISNFAKPGMRAVHNGSYWSGGKYLGIGPSAHSYDGRRRMWAVADIRAYLKGVDRGKIYEEEVLTKEDMYNEFVMTSLRTSDGIDTSELKARFGAGMLEEFLSSASRHTGSGLLVNEGDIWKIPPEKFLLSDLLISELFCG